jgi:GT2 family glycosyltransferase
MSDDKLAIIIPAFSGHEQIRRCLESLYNSTYSDFDVIVVDHGITDEITRLVNAGFPEVTCIRGSADLWWSGATNLGIRCAMDNGSKLLMLLNHDCYVREDTIDRLLEHMETAPGAIIAPVQHNLGTGKDTIGATSFFLLGFSTIIPPAGWYRLLHSKPLVPTRLIVGGRGAVVRASTFRKVGYFDETHLPHYGADHDFYFRCRKSGISLFVCKDAFVDLDNTQTTTANADKRISPAEFAATLKNRSSHRNIRDLYALFSRHYPIPGLAVLGVALNLLRYSLLSLVRAVAGSR